MGLLVAITCDPALHWMDYRIEVNGIALAWQTDSFRDSFRELLIAIGDALGGQSTYVEFTDVPLARRLSLEPSGERLVLSLLEYDNWPILQSAIGHPLGSVDVRLSTFAGAVLSQGQILGADIAAYERASRHIFPQDRLAHLALVLRGK